ncbi:MAG: hypothetical protein ACTTI3_06675 [Treponema sp.]
MKKIVFFLIDWVWCLPQTLMGFVLSKTLWKGAHMQELFSKKFGVFVLLSTPWMEERSNLLFKKISGFSTGRYIFLHYPDCDEKTIRHECGHSRQSRRLGWLYLPVVGIPSAINNLRSRFDEHVWKTYYQRYPESWADRLGGVNRTSGA